MTAPPGPAPGGSAQKTVLIVEDEAQARRDASSALSAQGYRVVESDLAKPGWELFLSKRPDLVILDLNLPDGGGLEICRKIREHKELKSTPVILLTGRGEIDDKVSGFAAGADQYLVKPVLPSELALWVAALLRRVSYDSGDGDVMKVGDLELDFKAQLVRFAGRTIADLTAKEFDLLYFLVKKRPQVVSRKQILSQLWHTVAIDGLVDTHLHNLRRKLPQALADRIQAIRGKGFRFLD